ncbi:MAG TPA: DUF4097 family beta strand repeat-containing protein [Thermoanaerobaculia bacterium]|nr:DUF4097 family beta strand repeat-containing protein [Thermoanaerobaculia bacterium]
MKYRVLIATLLVIAAAAAYGSVGKTFRVVENFEIKSDGTLILENGIGDIEITGTETSVITAEVLKTIVATEEEGLEEGRYFTELVVGGDATTRVLRTVMGGGPRKRQWTSTVYWRVTVPRSINVRVASTTSNRIKLSNIRGSAFVKNFNGAVIFDNVAGVATADSVNGSILYSAASVQAETHLSTLNGHITVRVEPGADVRWIAETVGGDIRTNLPVRGIIAGPSFRGSVNAPGGTLLTTATLTGSIQFLGNGVPDNMIKSVRSMERIIIPPEQINVRNAGLRRGVVEGSVTYNTMSGDIVLTEVRGGAILSTNAGRVQLGSVFGDCNVRSNGPLQLGEILGSLKAMTSAGDVFVEAARRGGTVETTGGTIRLLYTGGPTRLTSGGGDIFVRQAAGPIDAATRSGDITIGVDRETRRQKLEAETEKGNIVLNVGPVFGADFDLTVITDDPNANVIQADFAGLSMSRDQVDGKTRIRATGRINGGGERVTMQATGGSIKIVTAPVGPALLGR